MIILLLSEFKHHRSGQELQTLISAACYLLVD